MQRILTLVLAGSVSAVALGTLGIPAAKAADMGVPPGPPQQAYAPPQQAYGPPPVEEGYGYPPPVAYYPPPVAYYAPWPGPYYCCGPYWRGYGPRFGFGFGPGPRFAGGWGGGRWGGGGGRWGGGFRR